jgi:hypothetical protein
MKLDTTDVVQYTAADMDKELLIGKPHHKMYIYYVMAMVDFGDGEYQKYQNGLEMANTTFNEWAKWWQRTYGTPASRSYNVFLSAYGIAVKHGYTGTEEEWLLSLVGPQGEQGPAGPQGPKGQDGTVAFESLTEAQVEMLRGPMGPVGPEGQRGPIGYTGAEGPAGSDGYSPTVKVTAIAGGHRVSITDVNGTKTFDVMDGEDGAGGGGGSGGSGEKGATFYPYVDANGNLSWTNDGGLSNPETVNIKGPAGKDGKDGERGPAGQDGKDGATGPAGKDGAAGPAGADGAPAKINGVNILTIEVDENLTITQNGSVLKIGLGKVPENSNSTVVALLASNWVEDNGEYSQTVAVPFMTETAKVVNVDVQKTGTDKAADNEVEAGWALISGATDPVQLDGAVKFYAYEIPTVNVPVKVGVA